MSGFLPGTNIPSESWRAHPASNVATWLKSARAAGRGAKEWRNPPVKPRFGAHNLRVFLKSQVKAAQLISVVTVGELRKGAILLPPGAKRTQIECSIEVLIPAWFGKRVLPVTRMIAERWGTLDAQRQQIGRPLGVADGVIEPRHSNCLSS